MKQSNTKATKQEKPHFRFGLDMLLEKQWRWVKLENDYMKLSLEHFSPNTEDERYELILWTRAVYVEKDRNNELTITYKNDRESDVFVDTDLKRLLSLIEFVAIELVGDNHDQEASAFDIIAEKLA